MMKQGLLLQNRDMALRIACVAAGLLLQLFLAGGAASAEELASPRLGALRQEVKAGGAAALERFWRRLAEEGTPLVEPVEDGNERLVTFLLRGGYETLNVLGVGSPSDLATEEGIEGGPLRPLPSTEVLYQFRPLKVHARFA